MSFCCCQNKCTQYWPNINDKLQAGVITIRNVEEKMYAENTIRKFKIYHNEVRSYFTELQSYAIINYVLVGFFVGWDIIFACLYIFNTSNSRFKILKKFMI